MEDGMETVGQRVSESASQLETALGIAVHALEVLPEGITATEDETFQAAFAQLNERVQQLEAALDEMRSLKASASIGRKTQSSMLASGSAGVDDALGSLSVEQRIAVKSGLMRAGLL